MHDIRLGDQLGKGQFGLLNKGVMHRDGKKMDVAVKTLENREDRVKFLKKAVVIAQFKHKYVVMAYGVVREPVSGLAMHMYVLATYM